MVEFTWSRAKARRAIRPRRRSALLAGVLLVMLSGCAGTPKEPEAPGRALTSGAEEAEDLFHRGRDAFQRGDSVRAEQYLTLALSGGHPPDRVVPLLLQVCLSNSRLRAALNHADPYLLEHPSDDRLRYLVATIHASLGEEADAWAELEHLVHRNSRYADAYYLMGVLALRGDPEAAREHFREYLELDPKGGHAAEVQSRLSQLAVRDTSRRTSVSLSERAGSAHEDEQEDIEP